MCFNYIKSMMACMKRLRLRRTREPHARPHVDRGGSPALHRLTLDRIVALEDGAIVEDAERVLMGAVAKTIAQDENLVPA